MNKAVINIDLQAWCGQNFACFLGKYLSTGWTSLSYSKKIIHDLYSPPSHCRMQWEGFLGAMSRLICSGPQKKQNYGLKELKKLTVEICEIAGKQLELSLGLDGLGTVRVYPLPPR